MPETLDPMTRDPMELAPPDIAPYKQGNTGIDYVTTFKAAQPGPHVMVSALVHGNELCGAIALDALFRAGVRPRRGRLTLGFMNPAAFARFDPQEPSASRFVEEDLNRQWSESVLAGEGDSLELRRARELRPMIDTVDLLLDLHSMQEACAPLAMAGPLAKGRALARAVGVPAIVVSDAGHAGGRRLRDYGAFAEAGSEKNALLVECGQHWARTSAEVAQEVTQRFLVQSGVIAPNLASAQLDPGAGRNLEPAPPQRFIEVTEAVTMTTGEFHFTEAFRGLEVIEKAGTVIGADGDRPVVTPYDDCVLIMPTRRRVPGQTAVRFGRYIE